LVGQKLYESKVNPPLVAAGVNLAFWPIGFFIRSLGAYFVRRSARQDRIHALVLKRYVSYLVKRGHAQEFFIEGGRSRSGKMRTPKLGLLSIMVDAFVKGVRRDLAFVPVSITYENVVEDKSFGDENSGKAKERESLRSLLKVPAIFGKSYGEVMIQFGQPLLLAEMTSSQSPKDTRSLAREVAQALTHRIQIQTNPSLTALIYTALMCSPRYGLTRAELIEQVQGLALVARTAAEIEPGCGKPTPSLERFLSGHHAAISDITRSTVVQIAHAIGQEVYYIPGKRRFTADFYKNSLLHLFLPNSLFAILHLTHGKFRPEDAAIFYDVLKNDLMLPAREMFLAALQQWASKLEQLGFVSKDEQGQLTILKAPPGVFLPTLMSGSIEAVLWVMSNISSLAGSDRKVSQKLLMTQLQSDHKAAAYLGLTSRTEAGSQSSLQSALEILTTIGVISIHEGASDDVTILKDHSNELEFLKLAQRAIFRWQNQARDNVA
jgi:glycerol-3-phosphate O-acyltransferase